VRESRLVPINEDEGKSTAAGVSVVYQINRGQTKHSALDRMLGTQLPLGCGPLALRIALGPPPSGSNLLILEKKQKCEPNPYGRGLIMGLRGVRAGDFCVNI
jgi:hypothetical protein